MTPNVPWPVKPPTLRATIAACGLGHESAREGDALSSLGALAAAWEIDLPPRPAASAARLIAPRGHSAYALFDRWLMRSMPPDATARLGALAQATVGARLELIAFRGRQEFDVVQEIAAPLWPEVLAAWGGLADQQRRRLHHLRRTLEVVRDLGQLTPRRLANLISALDELRRIFADAYRYPRYTRAVPNLFAALETRWEPELGTIEDEIVFAATQLLMIGSEASASLIGPLVDMAMQRPKLLAQLRANPSRVAAFVEEKQANFMQRRNAPRETAKSGLAFEFVGRQLAKAQAVAVLRALLCIPIEIEAKKRSASWHTRSDGTRQLDHLGLRFIA
jgi:hypothetical protein